MKANEVIAKIAQQKADAKSTRKVVNKDDHATMTAAILNDPSYEFQVLEGFEEGQPQTVTKNPAKAIKAVIATAFRKTGMTEAEATEAALSVHVTKAQAAEIAEGVHESDYQTINAGGKVSLIKRVGLDVAITLEDAKEQIRKNPRDPNKKTRIKARKRVKVHHKLQAFQKELV